MLQILLSTYTQRLRMHRALHLRACLSVIEPGAQKYYHTPLETLGIDWQYILPLLATHECEVDVECSDHIRDVHTGSSHPSQTLAIEQVIEYPLVVDQ